MITFISYLHKIKSIVSLIEFIVNFHEMSYKLEQLEESLNDYINLHFYTFYITCIIKILCVLD